MEKFKVGMWVADSEGNEFKITEWKVAQDEFHYDGVTLKNRRGEKEIASNDLQFYIIVDR
jgi:hypothetical protein